MGLLLQYGVLVTVTGDLGSDYMEAREINNNSIEGKTIALLEAMWMVANRVHTNSPSKMSRVSLFISSRNDSSNIKTNKIV